MRKREAVRTRVMGGEYVPPNQRSSSYVAIEVKRRAGIDAVDQLLRYMECLNRDSTMAPVRGIVVALTVTPQAKKYAWTKGIKTVEVDFDELRGSRVDELKLF